MDENSCANCECESDTEGWKGPHCVLRIIAGIGGKKQVEPYYVCPFHKLRKDRRNL